MSPEVREWLVVLQLLREDTEVATAVVNQDLTRT